MNHLLSRMAHVNAMHRAGINEPLGLEPPMRFEDRIAHMAHDNTMRRAGIKEPTIPELPSTTLSERNALIAQENVLRRAGIDDPPHVRKITPYSERSVLDSPFPDNPLLK